jgi:ethanolamine utilization protein EutA
VEGLASLVAEQIPIIVMVDEDMAKALGWIAHASNC